MTKTRRAESSSDEALMARYANGDCAAFDELFRRYEPRAYAYFRRRTGSAERAEDLYQEVFLRIHRARRRYDPARPFAPWFFQVARRALIDDHRHPHHTREIAMKELDVAGDGRLVDDVANRQEVVRILGGLSAEERVVLIAAKVEGLGYPQLAARLGRSPAAVKQLASRAMRRLRSAHAPFVAAARTARST
jgi:RNA polymerase sigma-70 factor (ECF subfamily)